MIKKYIVLVLLIISPVLMAAVQGDMMMNYQDTTNSLRSYRAFGTQSGGITVSPANATYAVSSQATVTNVASRVLNTTATRYSAAIRNLGPGAVYCCASGVTSTNGFTVNSGEILTIDNYIAQVWLITSGSNTALVNVIELY